MDLFGGPVGVDPFDKGIIECRKNVVALLQRFPLFEFIGLAITNPNSRESGVEIEFEKKDMVRERSELFVDLANFSRIETPGSLVGHGGKEVSIQNHDSASGQTGFNKGFDMFPSVDMEEVKFLLWREPAGRGGLAELGAGRPVGGFLGRDDLVPPFPERLGKEADLSRLSRSVDSFENYEHEGG